jgi:16S rRNA (cytosine1402-N4)-methyltransferase
MRTGDQSWLAPDARIGIIAFHSLEDRPVKTCFAALVQEGLAVDLSAGAVRAGDDEQDRNPRSRSAKLRVIRRV